MGYRKEKDYQVKSEVLLMAISFVTCRAMVPPTARTPRENIIPSEPTFFSILLID